MGKRPQPPALLLLLPPGHGCSAAPQLWSIVLPYYLSLETPGPIHHHPNSLMVKSNQLVIKITTATWLLTSKHPCCGYISARGTSISNREKSRSTGTGEKGKSVFAAWQKGQPRIWKERQIPVLWNHMDPLRSAINIDPLWRSGLAYDCDFLWSRVLNLWYLK